MVNTTSNTSALLRPEQVHDLLVLPVARLSVAAQVATVVFTDSKEYRFPRVTADPTAAWVAEGEEIPASDLTVSEIVVTPRKVAGLSVITTELAEDSSPEASTAVGEGIARDIARQVDQAFFSTHPDADAPDGLADVAGVTAFNSGGAAWTNLDPFARAISNSADVGASLDRFVTNPADMLALSQIKEATGSNRPLLGPDPTQGGRTTAFGVPVLTSPFVPPGIVYGLDSRRVFVVVRRDATVGSDSSVFYTSDRVAVKGTMRVGFGFPHAASIVRITKAA